MLTSTSCPYSFLLSVAMKNLNCISSNRFWLVPSRNQPFREHFENPECWMHIPLFSFSLEKSLSQSILSQPWAVAAWVKLMWVKLNCSSYPFQCSCSWLFATLGYFHFLIGFWNSHKSFLVHNLLSNWLDFLLRNKGWGFLVSHLVDITLESALF